MAETIQPLMLMKCFKSSDRHFTVSMQWEDKLKQFQLVAVSDPSECLRFLETNFLETNFQDGTLTYAGISTFSKGNQKYLIVFFTHLDTFVVIHLKERCWTSNAFMLSKAGNINPLSRIFEARAIRPVFLGNPTDHLISFIREFGGVVLEAGRIADVEDIARRSKDRKKLNFNGTRQEFIDSVMRFIFVPPQTVADQPTIPKKAKFIKKKGKAVHHLKSFSHPTAVHISGSVFDIESGILAKLLLESFVAAKFTVRWKNLLVDLAL